MNTYSSADLLGYEIFWNSNKKKKVTDYISAFISSLNKTVDLHIEIPTSIFLRTKQICKYIEENICVRFDIVSFIMILYIEFIENAVTERSTLDICKLINDFSPDDKIIISNGHEVCECSLKENSKTKIIISMDKKLVIRGELLLAELYELYGYKMTFEKTLEAIWTSFIYNYLKGDSKKALTAIINTVKSSI